MRRSDIIWLTFALLLSIGISLYSRPDYSFTWDSQNKLVQAYSLWANGFRSEELAYPFKEWDPNYRFFPQGANAFGKINGRYVSAFPVALAAMYGPLLHILGASGIMILSGLWILPGIWILFRYWEFKGPWLIIPVTCTFLWSFLLEYSEHLMVAFLSFAGISLFLRTKKSVRNSLLAGAICATALFFRHEVFVFLFAFGLAYLLGGRKNDKNSGATIPHHLQELAAFTTGALIIAVAFAALNGLLYSHPLGPRYLINADGLDVTAGIRAHWAIDLLFWHGIKPGLLGYIPALLPILILGLILAPRLAPEYRTLLLLILIYIPLVLLIVPNNGIMDWGPRYFGPILLPALALARHIWRSDEWASNQRDGRNRWGTILRATLIVLSITPFALNIVGTNYLRKARKQSRQIIQKLEERKADIWVFADLGIFYYSSAEYLHRPILVRGDGNIESLLSLLHQSNAGKKMILVSLSPGIAQDSGASDGSPKGRDTESKNDEVAATIRTNTLTPAESIAVRNWLRSSSEDTIDPGLQLLTGTIP